MWSVCVCAWVWLWSPPLLSWRHFGGCAGGWGGADFWEVGWERCLSSGCPTQPVHARLTREPLFFYDSLLSGSSTTAENI